MWHRVVAVRCRVLSAECTRAADCLCSFRMSREPTDGLSVLSFTSVQLPVPYTVAPLGPPGGG